MTVYQRKRLTVSADIGLSRTLLPLQLLPEPAPAAPIELPPSAAPTPLQPSAATQAMCEVLQLPPLWITQLPLATTLLLATPAGAECTVTTSRAHYAHQRAAGACVLAGSELGALALAAENGRASAPWLAGWLADRAADPTIALTPATALGGIAAPQTPHPRWPLVHVLAAWGLQLTAVGVGDAASPDWI
jgi:hypothetical protein